MWDSVVSDISILGDRKGKVVLKGGVSCQIGVFTDLLRIDIIPTVNDSHPDDISPVTNLIGKLFEHRSKVSAVTAPTGIKLHQPGMRLSRDGVMEVGVVEDDNIVIVGVETSRSIIGLYSHYHTKQYLI